MSARAALRALAARARPASAPTAPLRDAPSRREILRAARVLAVRSRRVAAGPFAGAYASAFRGGGMEFHESRPYAPGDDVRAFDWNAMARTGEPFVKRFREERHQTLWLLLDVSTSMGFGPGGSALGAGVRAAALLAAAAARAGDRVGLLAFDEGLRAEVPPARGPAHGWRVIRRAAALAGAPGGGTRLRVGLEALARHARSRSVCVLLSDFRDPAVSVHGPAASGLGERRAALRAALAAVGRRHDLVSAPLYHPLEVSPPAAGLLRLEDPERPGRTRLLPSSRSGARLRYRLAWARHHRDLERALRAGGGDVLWLRSDRDPLPALLAFFRRRSAPARSPR